MGFSLFVFVFLSLRLFFFRPTAVYNLGRMCLKYERYATAPSAKSKKDLIKHETLTSIIKPGSDSPILATSRQNDNLIEPFTIYKP